MSIPNRIWNIGKSYLNQVRDRIDDALAEKELDMATAEAGLPPSDDTSPDAMMRRAQARIDSARRDLEARQGRVGVEPVTGTTAPVVPASQSAAGTVETDPNYRDYKILGVAVGSDLAVVQAAYENLIRRCDPDRFEAGSEEQKTAAQILVKINAAYDALRKRLDPTQNRFDKLELE